MISLKFFWLVPIHTHYPRCMKIKRYNHSAFIIWINFSTGLPPLSGITTFPVSQVMVVLLSYNSSPSYRQYYFYYITFFLKIVFNFNFILCVLFSLHVCLCTTHVPSILLGPYQLPWNQSDGGHNHHVSAGDWAKVLWSQCSQPLSHFLRLPSLPASLVYQHLCCFFPLYFIFQMYTYV